MKQGAKLSPTLSSQRDVEKSLLSFLKVYCPYVYALWNSTAEAQLDPSAKPLVLFRKNHLDFLTHEMDPLCWANEYTYASQPWLVYWATQAAETLGVKQELFHLVPKRDIVEYLLLHVIEEGGETEEGQRKQSICFFAGSPRGKGPHLLSSYAACCALCILDVDSLMHLPREGIKRWLLSIRKNDGSFSVHRFGESDIRCSYAVAMITTLLSLDDPTTFPEDCDLARTSILTPEVGNYVVSCQNHEGGFSCVPHGSEAHGSYTFCALGTLFLLRQAHQCYIPSLRRWLAFRQCSFEGGFNGRTNKLVDSCYSYWVGASHVMLLAEEYYRQLLRSTEVSEKKGRKCMLAKQLALLHFVQLVDLEGCIPTDVDFWDASETESLKEQDLIDQFLSVEDGTVKTANAFASRKKAFEKLRGDTELLNEFADASVGDFYFNQRRLQLYILQACQSAGGGLRDKPDVRVDTYHSCYSLSGLSLAQNLQFASLSDSGSEYVKRAFLKGYLPSTKTGVDLSANPHLASSYGVVLPIQGHSVQTYSSLVRSINPIFNLHRNRVLDAWQLYNLRFTI